MEATTAAVEAPATTKSTAMEAASVSTTAAATTSVTAAATTAAACECRSWLSQADRCQCEQGYNRFPHHASCLGRSRSRIGHFRSGIYSAVEERSQ
jgi:hypothetical protein